MTPRAVSTGGTHEYIHFDVASVRSTIHTHGGPSEVGDCSHPPPKMATAETRLQMRPLFTML